MKLYVLKKNDKDEMGTCHLCRNLFPLEQLIERKGRGLLCPKCKEQYEIQSYEGFISMQEIDNSKGEKIHNLIALLSKKTYDFEYLSRSVKIKSKIKSTLNRWVLISFDKEKKRWNITLIAQPEGRRQYKTTYYANDRIAFNLIENWLNDNISFYMLRYTLESIIERYEL